MVEPGLGKRAKGLARDPDRGGDEIGVEPGGTRAGRDVDEVAPFIPPVKKPACKEDLELLNSAIEAVADAVYRAVTRPFTRSQAGSDLLV